MSKGNAALLERMTRVLDTDGKRLGLASAIEFINSFTYGQEKARVKVTIKRYCGEFDADVINGGILRGLEEPLVSSDSNTLWLTSSSDLDSVGINVNIIDRIEIFLPQGL